MKDNAKLVFNYLKEHKGEKLTAYDVALATGLTQRQVNAIFTMAIQKQGLGYREPGQIRKDDLYVNVKYLILNDDGHKVNPE